MLSILLVIEESLLLFRLLFALPQDRKLLTIWIYEPFYFFEADELPLYNRLAFFIYLDAAVCNLGESLSLILMIVSSFEHFNLPKGEMRTLFPEFIYLGFIFWFSIILMGEVPVDKQCLIEYMPLEIVTWD